MANKKKAGRKGARRLGAAHLAGFPAALRKQLEGRILVDHSFRQRLLAQPEKALRQLGIKPRRKFVEQLAQKKARISRAATKSDALLELKVYGLLPVSGGGARDRNRRRRRR